ncbi:hypothetical protein Bca4012_062362 [Brassica carinata]
MINTKHQIKSNRTFALSLIWKLFSLNGSYWDVKDNRGSWVWRKLLNPRPIAYECLHFDIKDGKSVSFWFDNWFGLGKLLDLTDWEDTVSYILNSSRCKLDTVLIKCALQTSIYTLWKERNSRRHGGVCAPVEKTSKAIGRVIKNHISSLKYKGNHKLQVCLGDGLKSIQSRYSYSFILYKEQYINSL